MFSTLRSYFKIPPELRGMMKEKKISGTHTPAEWLKLLRPLAPLERDDTPGKNVGTGCLLSLGCVILLVVATQQNSVVLGFVIALFLPVCWFVAHRIRRRITLVGQHLAQAVLPMLLVLREDMAPDGKLSLTLDLRGARTPTKIISQRDLPVSRPITKLKVITYRDRWIEGEGVLADGTQLLWSIDDHVRETNRSKRNPRGKTKSKTKFKRTTHLKLRLGLRSATYALRPRDPKNKTKTPMPSVETSGKRHWFKLQHSVRGREFAPADFVGPIIDAYAFTQPAASSS